MTGTLSFELMHLWRILQFTKHFCIMTNAFEVVAETCKCRSKKTPLFYDKLYITM